MASPAKITIKERNSNPDNNLYDITFQTHHITTTVTSDPTVVTAWLSTISPTATIVGLDVEWRPNRSRQSDNPIATLQLCVGPSPTPACLIFQLLHCPTSIPKPLSDFLSSGSHTFVGVGIESDVEKLLCDHELAVKKAVDLAEVAAEKAAMRRGMGLKELAKEVIGVVVEKPRSVTMSRWDAAWLSYQQIQYACVDAFLSFEIGTRLLLGSTSSSSSSSCL